MATLSDAQIAGVLRAAGWPVSTISNMVAIALAESGGNAAAVSKPNSNGTIDRGLLQINSVHNFSGNLLDPLTNAKAGLAVYNAQGFRAWSTYNSGSYLVFVPRGLAASGHPDSNYAGNGTSSNGSSNGSSAGNTGSADPNSQLAGISTPSTWLRLGMYAMGGVLLLIGIDKLPGVSVSGAVKKAAVLAA